MIRTPTTRSSLAIATVALIALALSGVASIFISSLQPTDAALSAHELELNLSELRPGEVMRIDWEGTEVLVLRRTNEQIEWLKTYKPPSLRPNRDEEPLSAAFDQGSRSLQEKYFIGAVWKNGQHYTLRESTRHSYWCDDFRYFSGKLHVAGDAVFPGGFYCARMYSDQFVAPDLQKTPFVYDPAGRSSSEWIMPLAIPRHELHGEKLVLGKRD